MGLDPKSLGREVITRAAAARMEFLGIADIRDYAAKISLDKDELKELIELIVVSETWFFRDSHPFDLLKKHAVGHIAKYGPPYRVLSAPCATGEEPYSIVIALLDAGLSPKSFTVDGVDISDRALDKARNGLYTSYSFRSDPVNRRYFTLSDQGFEILDSVKKAGAFFQRTTCSSPIISAQMSGMNPFFAEIS